jgi:hypothetical protein
MTSQFKPAGNLTVQQLLERERALRMLAATALTSKESSALLALVEHYEDLVAERQGQETQPYGVFRSSE